MAAKYTVSTSASSTDRLSGVQIATVTLADGTVVWVDWDPTAGAYKLRYTNSRTAVDGTIATLAGLATPSSTKPGIVVIAVDSSDNLYVAGQSSASISKLQLQAFVKGAGYTWTAKTAATYDGTGSSYNYTALGIVWCNTGGGTSSGGHVLVAAQDTGAAAKDFQTFDAGLLLVNTLSTISQVSFANQAVTNVGSPAGFNMASDGLGATTVAAVFPHNMTGTWHLVSVAVSSGGTPTVTSINTFTAGSAAPATGQRARMIRYASNAWVALVVNETSGAITGQRCSATALIGTAAAMGTITDVPNFHTSPLLWDAFFDPTSTNKILVLCRSSATASTLYRIGCNVGSSVAWDTTTTADDTGVGNTITNLRANKIPKAPYVDWHVENFDGTNYELYGDYTNLNVAPNAPTLTAPTGSVTIDRGITQRFSWVFSDPNVGDSQSQFDLQYRVGTGAWTTVTATTPNQFYDFAPSTFAAGSYEWQVRTYDALGVVGPWSASGFFTAATAPSIPTITAPANNSTVSLATWTLTWTEPSQDAYQVRKVADLAGAPDATTIYYDSGTVTDTVARSVVLAFPVNSRTEHLQVRVLKSGLWSAWADVTVMVAWSPPAVSNITVTPSSPNAAITVTYSQPTPSGGQPTVAYVDIYRNDGAGSIRLAANLPVTGAWTDYTPASKVAYTYRVVATATTGTTSSTAETS